jgi:hypothetical protein
MSNYTVLPNDTREIIAQRFGIPWNVILADPHNTPVRERYANDPYAPRPGDILFIPERPQTVSMPPSSAVVQLFRSRRDYLERAYRNAFGESYNPANDEQTWNPSAGWRGNRDRNRRVYAYYTATFRRQPDRLIWAGLGKLAGAAVYGGMERNLNMDGETMLGQRFCRIVKSIFHDVAWLHEAFLDSPNAAVSLAATADAEPRSDLPPIRRRSQEAWQHIASGEPARVAEGNLLLLFHEQHIIIQPHYDALRSAGFGRTLHMINAVTNNIHPFHRPFIWQFPRGEVTQVRDRWAWITEPFGMWQRWVEIPASERMRLVNLSLEDLFAHQWRPIPAEAQPFLPPGASGSESV